MSDFIDNEIMHKKYLNAFSDWLITYAQYKFSSILCPVYYIMYEDNIKLPDFIQLSKVSLFSPLASNDFVIIRSCNVFLPDGT